MSKKLSPISLRLTEKQHEGLKQIAENTGADTAFLVRTAIDGLINYVQASGGQLHLPINFSQAWTELKEILDQLDQHEDQDQ